MRDLIRLSDEELHELTTRQRLKIIVAIGISLGCGIISLQGMAALFTDATVVPLPGMQHLGGQIAWAVGLVAMLILVTFLVRGVVKRRLQWGIALSLLIHFLLCLSMTTVEFRGPRPQPLQAADLSEVPREEFSLPDYAGMEIPSADAPWKEATESETPEPEREPDRSEIELAESEKAVAENSELPIQAEAIETPDRQEKVELSADAREEMQKQATANSPVTKNEVELPNVTTAEAEQAKIEAQVSQQKQATEVPIIERQIENIAATETKIEAAEMQAKRSESAVLLESVEAEKTLRSVTDVRAAAEVAEDNIKVETAAAQRMPLQESQASVARQRTRANAADAEAALSEAPSSADQPIVIQSRIPQRSNSGSTRETSQTPSDGGSVAITRRPASAADAASGDAQGEAVEVSSSGAVSSATMKESALARAGQRGSTAKAPAGSTAPGSGTGALSVPGGESANGDLRSSRIARSSNGTGQPALGDAGGSPMADSRGTGRQVTGADSSAKEAGTGTVPSKGTTNGESLVAGPAKTSIGRRSTGLPSSITSGTPGKIGSGSEPSTALSSSGTEPMRAAISGIAAGRGTEPSAKLEAADGSETGLQPRLAMSRTNGVTASLPTGAAEAEQTGTLVFAGPQAVSAGAGVSGPRISSLPRRSPGLPGTSGPAGSATTPPASAAQPTKIAVSPGRRGTGNDRPTIAATETIAGLVKRSVQGLGGSAEARIPDSLSMRATDARREAARTLGGSEASEEAVEQGLEWLARNQYPDGHWSIHDFPGEDSPELGQGSFESNSAATGLSLLAYLGAGYTHQSGKYQDVVARGMKWLLDNQKPNGDLFADETEFVWFYSHGIASIAMCEAYGLTKDPALKEPSQKALDFIVESQHPEFGGWRYGPRFESDTSVSGWQLMALKSGEIAGLKVPKEAYSRVSNWLDSVQSKSTAGQFSYHPSRDASAAMTAEGLLMRQYLGAKRDDAELIAGANFLRIRLPDFGQRDSYYWYYATQVMFHMQGEHWEEWNAGLRDLLVTTQAKEGSAKGSWDPDRPVREKWANGGGRHYLTCLNLLMLEVYYRHLPLYLELEK